MGTARDVLCLRYNHNVTYEWDSEIPRLTECDLFITTPLILIAYIVLVSLPYLIILGRKVRQRQRLSIPYVLKHIAYLMLLIVLLWKFVNITNDTNFYAWNYLYPGSLCTLILFQLLIVNLESVRDRTSSAVYFLGCLFFFIVTVVSVWNTVSYRLRSPDSGQLGFINVTFPPNWILSISPHELSEYLLCICAFFNFLLAFFGDRYVPPAPMALLTPPVRPEDQPADFDLVATDDKLSMDMVKLEDEISDKKSKEPEPAGGKKSPEEASISVNVSVQTCPNNFCYLCCYQLVSDSDIQSHVLLLAHAPLKFGDTELSHTCRHCREHVPLKWGPTHKCCSLNSIYIGRNCRSPVIQGGPPNRCLLCRGRALKSRSDLIVHLLAFHRPDRPRGHCGLCEFTFEEASPGLPKIPPPPNNAEAQVMREYRKALRKAELREMLTMEAGELKPDEGRLEQHWTLKHAPLYRLISRRVVHEDARLRAPYACLLCHRIYKNNWDSHAHILCRHGVKSNLESNLFTCAMCLESSNSEVDFDKHVQFQHCDKIQCLANFLLSNEMFMDVSDCSATCYVCWECFEEDFELQAHLLTAHCSSCFLRCGSCELDFSGSLSPLDSFLIFLNHEHNHARELHLTALDMHMTVKAMSEALPDDMTKESVVASLKALTGPTGSAEEAAPKSGKSHSKSKDSKKSKSYKGSILLSDESSSFAFQTLCPEKYVSFPSRVTFFWVTKLIILGYRNTLQLGHLWVLEAKNLSVNVVPPFLRSISKYLHVDITDELDASHTAASQFSNTWPAHDSSTSTSEDQKPGVAVSNANIADEHSARRSTFAEFNAFDKNTDVTSEGARGAKDKVDKRRKTMSAVPDVDKKSASLGPSLLPNVQIHISGRSSKSKTSSSSKKCSSIADVETGLLGSNSAKYVPVGKLKVNKTESSGPGKAGASVKQRSRQGKCGLVKALACTYGFRLFIAGVFKFGHDVCLLSGPILFRYLLQFMSPDSKEPMWHGYSYAVAMFIIAFLQSILLHQYFRAQNVIGMDMRTSIISAVYRKSLRLSAASRGESTSGEITNLMSIDSQRFLILMLNIHVLWSGPFQVITAIYLLWQQLGPSVLAGILVLFVMIPINTLVARISKALQEKQLKTTDKRIKLISEILNGIRNNRVRMIDKLMAFHLMELMEFPDLNGNLTEI
ncbi:hypothetical protein Aperf_G00000087201 [Anoplocephala perfoliata]